MRKAVARNQSARQLFTVDVLREMEVSNVMLHQIDQAIIQQVDLARAGRLNNSEAVEVIRSARRRLREIQVPHPRPYLPQPPAKAQAQPIVTARTQPSGLQQFKLKAGEQFKAPTQFDLSVGIVGFVRQGSGLPWVPCKRPPCKRPPPLLPLRHPPLQSPSSTSDVTPSKASPLRECEVPLLVNESHSDSAPPSSAGLMSLCSGISWRRGLLMWVVVLFSVWRFASSSKRSEYCH